MVKRLAPMLIITIAGMATTLTVSGCDNNSDTTIESVATEQTATSLADTENSDSAETDAKVTAIDWSKVDSGEPAATVADYEYPFAIDSQNVKNYADYFKVDNATAQHNLTISTASNEALSKVLDQLDTSYTSHQVIDGKDAKLVIHTTADIDASSYDYVFAEPFAKGLILPIEIVPDGVKSDIDVHGDYQEQEASL
ncbi:hypothetical protein [Psychrobacter sp. M13]|uniref:hypothetical protein n=1 Tax=Psychrobacter sp. M13 TaxID=3067275 RepID=UPI00273C20D2|nr:hypothetical protein [Psychrobacter sp. M13]WLP94929.1 hypothetical protein Q9G97_02065 [Psychrobacter sp. M13]